MTGSIVIEEIPIPADPDDGSFADYARTLGVRNAHEAQVMGSAGRFIDPVEALPSFQNQAHWHQRLYAGRLDGEIVAHALLRWSAEPGTRIAWMFGEVLPEARQRGVGTALFDHVEGIVRVLRRPVIQSFAWLVASDYGDRLPSPTGFGSLPLDDPGVRFMRRRGWDLGQIQRMSLLRLPLPPGRLDAMDLEAERFAGDGYEMVAWVGPTSERWLDGLAVLFSSQEADAPRGRMVNEPEEWDADRVRAEEARTERSGRIAMTAAAVHRPTGTLAGFTRLSISPDRTQPARQHSTVVLREHRGHRLGLAIKLANLRQLAQVSPGTTTIVAGNAEDNRPMLNVNETIGFVPIAYGGAWKKFLSPAGEEP
jgi:GNAT superfamily N-acetyltransferase